MRTAAYATLALLAFAANSVLCRLALSGGTIDAASFSTIRLAAGAITLLLVTTMTGERVAASGSWTSSAVLFLYAVPFSFAYTRLSTGTGALILFGSVQLTMMGGALRSGERPRPVQWLGLGLAFAGLLYLVRPGLAAPSPAAAALMALAGLSWGVYSLRGRGAATPLVQTTANFVRAVPFVLIVSVATVSELHIGRTGALLALASGAIASGLGYVIWYLALPRLTAARAAVVQLAVPVLAAAGGAIVLGEVISGRLVVAAAMVLGGIALALVGRS